MGICSSSSIPINNPDKKSSKLDSAAFDTRKKTEELELKIQVVLGVTVPSCKDSSISKGSSIFSNVPQNRPSHTHSESSSKSTDSENSNQNEDASNLDRKKVQPNVNLRVFQQREDPLRLKTEKEQLQRLQCLQNTNEVKEPPTKAESFIKFQEEDNISSHIEIGDSLSIHKDKLEKKIEGQEAPPKSLKTDFVMVQSNGIRNRVPLLSSDILTSSLMMKRSGGVRKEFQRLTSRIHTIHDGKFLKNVLE